MDEVSDTESSSEAFQRTASVEDLPESMSTLQSEKEEKEGGTEEEEEERKREEELRRERQEERGESISSQDLAINRYIEEAKQKAKELREKSEFHSSF